MELLGLRLGTSCCSVELRKEITLSKRKIKRRPATTVEGRENQMISLAFDLAEKRLVDGTATSQEVTHFLKLGSTRERLEQERLRGDVSMMATKAELMESQRRSEEMYTEALRAMRAYSGQSIEEEVVDED
jgi:hypothetical protein